MLGALKYPLLLLLLLLNITRVRTCASNCTDSMLLIIVFENSMGTCFVYITLVLQPVGLCKEVCLYSRADWCELICQSECGEKSIA